MAALGKRTIGTIPKESTTLGLGCWAFGGSGWGSQEDNDSRGAINTALEASINHLDTAQGYGDGRSEKIVGEFMPQHRDKVFLATKMFPSSTPTREEATAAVETSLGRLQTDSIDLFYIHWPKAGVDLRPLVEGLEDARGEGKIRGIGVSNFSVEQLNQVMQAGTIDAHQVGYSLFWRFPEKDVIPFCEQHGIATISYSSIAQGILTGKFGPEPKFPEGDQRAGNVLFDPAVYPHLHAGVEQLKRLSQECGHSLLSLAIQWCAAQPGIASVLVGARNGDQVRMNVEAMESEVPADILQRMTAISDEVHQKIPDTGNIFRFYP